MNLQEMLRNMLLFNVSARRESWKEGKKVDMLSPDSGSPYLSCPLTVEDMQAYDWEICSEES